jgi:hypothetical protein
MSGFSEQEILQAQRQWGDGIVAIGRAFTDGEDYRQRAEEHLDALYAFDDGQVLFKPTKAAEAQFRNDRVSALSYFVTGDADFAEDHGFALQPWVGVRFENVGFVLGEDIALAMGNYFFTDVHGEETKVEYSFGYVRDDRGRLKIVLHHSSLPFSG